MRPVALSFLAAALAAAVTSGPASAAGPNMKEGMWEITTKMEMPGRKDVAMPQQTVKHCLTKKDVEDPKQKVLGSGDQSRCKMTDYKLQGNTASWKVACEGQGSGAGTVTYNGDSYTGSQTMAINAGGQPMNMKMNFAGRRVGDCTK
ncbi:MAG TPA: DUF3617 family protein [Burkholderiales bacterium]|nr:DUF3617 family protein [Burkholderiales bacterium]